MAKGPTNLTFYIMRIAHPSLFLLIPSPLSPLNFSRFLFFSFQLCYVAICLIAGISALTCPVQLYMEHGGSLGTVGHGDGEGCVFRQLDDQGAVSVRADARNAEVPVMVGHGEELGGDARAE